MSDAIRKFLKSRFKSSKLAINNDIGAAISIARVDSRSAVHYVFAAKPGQAVTACARHNDVFAAPGGYRVVSAPCRDFVIASAGCDVLIAGACRCNDIVSISGVNRAGSASESDFILATACLYKAHYIDGRGNSIVTAACVDRDSAGATQCNDVFPSTGTNNVAAAECSHFVVAAVADEHRERCDCKIVVADRAVDKRVSERCYKRRIACVRRRCCRRRRRSVVVRDSADHRRAVRYGEIIAVRISIRRVAVAGGITRSRVLNDAVRAGENSDVVLPVRLEGLRGPAIHLEGEGACRRRAAIVVHEYLLADERALVLFIPYDDEFVSRDACQNCRGTCGVCCCLRFRVARRVSCEREWFSFRTCCADDGTARILARRVVSAGCHVGRRRFVWIRIVEANRTKGERAGTRSDILRIP